MMLRWKKKNTMITGTLAMTRPARSEFWVTGARGSGHSPTLMVIFAVGKDQ